MAFAVLLGAVGAIIGGLLALLAEVVPDASGGGQSPLICKNCGSTKSRTSLIPVRRPGTSCRKCLEPVSAMRVPVVIVTAVVFIVISLLVGQRWQLIPILVLTAAVIALSAVDLMRFRLPDRLVFPSVGLSVVVMSLLAISTETGDHVTRGIMAGLAYSALLLIPNLLMPSGLAFGDVKLALLLGLYLGWVSDSAVDAARLIVWAFLLGMVFGIFSGLFVGLGRRAFGPGFMPDPDYPPAPDGTLDPLLRTQAPFGPALAASALLLVVFANTLLSGSSILA